VKAAGGNEQKEALNMPETREANRIKWEAEAQYVKEGGVSCPFCRESNIEDSNVTIDNGIASQSITCTDCGEEWTDIYTLTGCTTEYN
jgi:transposase-like protein